MMPSRSDEELGAAIALRAVGRRIQYPSNEVKELDAELELRGRALAPALLNEAGIGPVNAAELVCAWLHPGRVRCEAAFSNLAGVAPIRASSGQTVRHRLNRCGDRKLNLTAMATKYAARRGVSPAGPERSEGAAKRLDTAPSAALPVRAHSNRPFRPKSPC